MTERITEDVITAAEGLRRAIDALRSPELATSPASWRRFGIVAVAVFAALHKHYLRRRRSARAQREAQQVALSLVAPALANLQAAAPHALTKEARMLIRMAESSHLVPRRA